MNHHPRLVETLRDAQRFGFFGPGSIEDAIVHAEAFTAAVARPAAGALVVDLGSGGGLPGLVVADEWDDVEILLVDRRQKRTDFLERAVRRLGFAHVSVRCGDVSELVADVVAGRQRRADVITARGFGPPSATLQTAAALRSPGGVVVISEPPDQERWDDAFVGQFGLSHRRVGSVRVFGPTI